MSHEGHEEMKVENPPEPLEEDGRAATSPPPNGVPIRIGEYYDFKWSRTLWRNAANKSARTWLALVVVFLSLEGFFSHLDGIHGVDIWYLMASSVTTVGLGDVSPQSQFHRATSLVMLPFGLVVVSLGISCSTAYSMSLNIVKVAASVEHKLEASADNILDKLGRVSGHSIEHHHKPSAAVVATCKGSPEKSTGYILLVMAVKYFFVLALGSTFFLFHVREQRLQDGNGVEMTVVDAAFFSAVVATSVGYGHMISPQTDAGKVFCIFYYLFSTIVVGGIITELSSLYLAMKRQQIEDVLIGSTTWVHKADLDREGNGA